MTTSRTPSSRSKCREDSSLRIVGVTGSRAEFGLLTPVFRAVEAHPALELEILATGQHLLASHGSTIDDIEAAGFELAGTVEFFRDEDADPYRPAAAVGRGIEGMTQQFARLKPDWVVILGDRLEAYAAASAAALCQIPICHLHGGDVSRGGLDESMRHAITKLAHLHCAATATSAERIRQMGESDERIHVVGAPGLDTVLGEHLPSVDELETELGISLSRDFLVVSQHPVSTQADAAADQLRLTLDALTAFAESVIVLAPNSDSGSAASLEVAASFCEAHDSFHFVTHLPHTFYLSLLEHAAVLIGNTSSGLIEAPSFGTPFIDIGIRQQGRERGANCISVDHDRTAIEDAVDVALNDDTWRTEVEEAENPYGDGRTGERVAELLALTPRSFELLQKAFVDWEQQL